jgi:hypothetical protein
MAARFTQSGVVMLEGLSKREYLGGEWSNDRESDFLIGKMSPQQNMHAS